MTQSLVLELHGLIYYDTVPNVRTAWAYVL